MAQWEKGPWGSGPLKECPLGKGLWEKGQLEKGKRQAPWLLLSPCCGETSAESLSHCLPAGIAVIKVLPARADCMAHSPIICYACTLSWAVCSCARHHWIYPHICTCQVRPDHQHVLANFFRKKQVLGQMFYDSTLTYSVEPVVTHQTSCLVSTGLCGVRQNQAGGSSVNTTGECGMYCVWAAPDCPGHQTSPSSLIFALQPEPC